VALLALGAAYRYISPSTFLTRYVPISTLYTGLLIFHSFLYQAMIFTVIRDSPGRRKERGRV
jgi:hypothetical protein